ncbi:hypothetical protein PHLCEN_2v5981 [Hermanssonia centrifuga]|uniref:Uncharacterized protein n=1 Tax=Hermanssonia centrifuga TaxID=98765 RepID=A0A2R6P0R6_9APHY|nr:hypothetical protein PHLCEN_2v5981 [Hermanssonia centrifuga]
MARASYDPKIGSYAFASKLATQPILDLSNVKASSEILSVESIAGVGVDQDKNALLSGVGKGSVGVEILKGLLPSGAHIVVTISRYSRATSTTHASFSVSAAEAPPLLWFLSIRIKTRRKGACRLHLCHPRLGRRPYSPFATFSLRYILPSLHSPFATFSLRYK